MSFFLVYAKTFENPVNYFRRSSELEAGIIFFFCCGAQLQFFMILNEFFRRYVTTLVSNYATSVMFTF